MVEALGMSAASADAAACRIEHSVTAEFIDRLDGFMDVLGEDDMAAVRRRYHAEAFLGQVRMHKRPEFSIVIHN